MAHEPPFISVIIPCYNVEPYIEECITSVLKQTFTALEIICVDDGSEDDTLAVLERLQGRHPDRIKVLAGPNQGAPAARNKGLAEARGEYVQFLDADDVLMPEKLAHQARLIRATPTPPDLIAADFIRVFEDGRRIVVRMRKADPWVNLIKTRLGITTSNLWKRSTVEAVGGWAEHMKSSQEPELMFRMLKAGGRVLYDEKPLSLLRVRPGSISSDNKPEKWLRYIDLRTEIQQYLEEKGLMRRDRKVALYENYFFSTRSLHKADPSHAVALHKRLLPRRYVPPFYNLSDFLYVLCYVVMGFEGVERFKASLKRS